MAKIKLFSGIKKCQDGELYKFRKEVKVTLTEFMTLNKEVEAAGE